MLTHYSKLHDTILHENPFSGPKFITYNQKKMAKLIWAFSQDSVANFAKRINIAVPTLYFETLVSYGCIHN
jgi:hypothetical protein